MTESLCEEEEDGGVTTNVYIRNVFDLSQRLRDYNVGIQHFI